MNQRDPQIPHHLQQIVQQLEQINQTLKVLAVRGVK
jgi:hypothetical protein